MYGIVHMVWDTLETSPAGFNNINSYYNGGITIIHETLHHLGVEHTFGTKGENAEAGATCDDSDMVSDTPSTFGKAVYSNPQQ